MLYELEYCGKVLIACSQSNVCVSVIRHRSAAYGGDLMRSNFIRTRGKYNTS